MPDDERRSFRRGTVGHTSKSTLTRAFDAAPSSPLMSLTNRRAASSCSVLLLHRYGPVMSDDASTLDGSISLTHTTNSSAVPSALFVCCVYELL